jgi:hypothetical protein
MFVQLHRTGHEVYRNQLGVSTLEPRLTMCRMMHLG